MAREPISGEDLRDAVFLFIELAASLDSHITRTGTWPVSIGPRKSADHAALATLESVVRALQDLRLRLQKPAVAAGAAVAVQAILASLHRGEVITPELVKKKWNSESPVPLKEEVAEEVRDALVNRKRERAAKLRDRTEAVLEIVGRAIGRGPSSIRKFFPREVGHPDLLEQPVGAHPTFLGQQIAVFSRRSDDAWRFALSGVFGWPTSRRRRTGLLRHYREWYEPWQWRAAMRRYHEAYAERKTIEDAKDAFTAFVKRFAPPPSNYAMMATTCEAVTWNKGDAERVERERVKPPTTPSPLRVGQVWCARAGVLVQMQIAQQSLRELERHGGLPPDRDVRSAVMRVEDWLKTAGEAIVVSYGSRREVVMTPGIRVTEDGPVVHWQSDGAYVFRAFFEARTKRDGSLVLFQPSERPLGSASASSGSCPTGRRPIEGPNVNPNRAEVDGGDRSGRGARAFRFVYASQQQLEEALDAHMACWPKRCQLWEAPNGDTTLATVASADWARWKGSLDREARLLCEFDADTFEEAAAIAHIRLGLAPFIPQGAASNCPRCGALYYPDGSGDCWNCHGWW